MSRAPIDPQVLESVLDPDLGAGRTLPADAYTSHEVFVWEGERFFDRGWTCLGRADDLGRPGDQRAYRVGRDGVLGVRGKDGILRAFHNTCRHRGHELLEPEGRRRLNAIKCPYHAWVYGLDGSLNGAPRFGDLAGFDKGEYPLVPVRIEEWHGWLFANPSGEADSFDTYVGNLDGLVEAWEVGQMFVGASHTYVIEANWKTITENYHECYHCPSIHPELCVVTPPDSGKNFAHEGLWVGGSMTLKDFAETMSLTGESQGVRIRGLSDRQAREVYYLGLFPNLLISLHPDYVLTHRLEPLAPGRTRIECQWLFPPEAQDRSDFSPEYAREFWDITNRQDWLACESVYRGLQDTGFRQGPFARSEDEVHSFMAMVARAYLDGRATRPPPLSAAARA